jgi:TonB family protein
MKACVKYAVVIGILAATVTVTAQDESLTAARDLYTSANYEDALVLLNRLRSASNQIEDGRAIDQYRAFCLLALGRPSDAEKAIEAVVAAEPSYKPSDSDVSPRVRSAFSDVRRRMLPSIIQQRYANAKQAFDRKDFVAAELGFKQVLEVLNDPDVGPAANQQPLADIRTLAIGFHDLSATAAVPPPPPAVAAAPPPPPSPAGPMPPRIYGPEDGNVVPPVTIRQTLPPFGFAITAPLPQGSLEIVIDELGRVQSAAIRKSVYSRYDAQLLEAARTWQYMPAMRDGVPVKYRKLVGITVKR